MWRRNPRGLSVVAVHTTVVAALLFGPVWVTAGAQVTDVTATVETQPVPSSGDAADDPAIWVHPTDPSLSTVIGTDKEGGLAVYDLAGRQLQYLAGIRPNNVDLRHGFPLGGQAVDLVVASDRGDDAVTLHRVDPQTRQLVPAGPPIDSGVDVYGVCMYRSPESGDFYVFVTSEEAGPVRQWLLTEGGGQMTATQVRDLDMGSTAEGCVADDDHGYLYVAEESVGIWKYEAEPDAGTARISVDQVGSTLEADVEGLAIYYRPEGDGYLIASSQGSGEFAAYERAGDNAHLSNFQIVDSASIDGTSDTDGIEVMSMPLGPNFPQGLFVAQDGDNDIGNQNFKLVPWEVVAGSSLSIDTSWNPRSGSAGLPHIPLPASAAPAGPVWTIASALVDEAADDGVLGADGILSGGEILAFQAGETIQLSFDGVEMPAGDISRSAHIQFTSADPGDGRLVLSIHGMLDDGSETEPVTWAPAAWASQGEGGAYQQTPDLSSIIREIVSAGWQQGDPLILVVRAEGQGTRTAVSFEGGSPPSLQFEHAPAN